MSSSWNVLLPREIDPTGPSAIADFADCTGMDEYDSIDDALADVDRYDAIIVRVAKLHRDVIERADRLRVIAKHGAGLDNVDIDAASEHNIVVCNTPGVNARSVAEHAIALLFGIQRNLHTADRHIRDGGWNRAAFRGRELRDTTLGLMGFGSIAKETAQLAEGVGMDVIVYDPHRTHVRDGVVRLGDLTELFERADAVSLHVPLTDETRGAVSTEQLAALGSDGVLINTARGGVVDEHALADALESGTIAGAALDTFTVEPVGRNNPLCALDNVLMTPHLGGATIKALERMSTGAADNVRTVYEGGLPESTVNKSAFNQEVTQ